MRNLDITTLVIEQGNPWENEYLEPFKGKVRDALINWEIFCTVKEAS